MDSTVPAARVKATLTVDVSDLTPEQCQRLTEEVERVVQRVMHPEDEEVIGGWTTTTLEEALNRLRRGQADVQARVIREALKHDGYLTRDSVFRIGKYDPNRMLRGFTRPTNRVVKEMKDSGVIPQDAVNLLSPSYQDSGTADGFRVPHALASLLST